VTIDNAMVDFANSHSRNIHHRNLGGGYVLYMQVLLTWHITNSANERDILNGSLAGVFMILFSYRRIEVGYDLYVVSKVYRHNGRHMIKSISIHCFFNSFKNFAALALSDLWIH
jgi:hypothetical protein